MKNRGRPSCTAISACMSSLVIALGAEAAILHVDPDAPGPTHDGTTWANAYLTIETAVAFAGSGDIIRVAGGETYKPANQGSSFSLKTLVSIQGGYAGYGTSDPNVRDTVL